MPGIISGRGDVVVTGAAGFIGSQIAARLYANPLILVDKLNLFEAREYNRGLIEKSLLIEADGVFLEKLPLMPSPSWIIHMGAISNTAERDLGALKKWNVDYTKHLWEYCTKNKINFIYASSAATYGNGSQGFSDDHDTLFQLEPLNAYGQSKQDFDLWALDQVEKGNSPPHWYGLKFFNVFGPNENHKGPMASSIWHGFNEINQTGFMTLFKSHNPKFQDGEQARDFIFIDDVLQIIDFLIAKTPDSDIYNCGTGKAGTFLDLAEGLFKALEKPVNISWIETPQEFRAGYQYRTEAVMDKLRKAGYTRAFTSLKDGIEKYLFRISK